MTKPNFISDYAQALTEVRPDPLEIEAKAREWRESNRSLEHRTRELLDRLPVEVRAGGLPLHWIRQKLKGRCKGRGANAPELAKVLRRLGYRRVRQWSAADSGFRALWQLRD